jgi:hypothetical protein
MKIILVIRKLIDYNDREETPSSLGTREFSSAL